MKADSVWQTLQISSDYLTAKSHWLAEERNLHSSSVVFFRDAGKLLGLSITDYGLSNLAFFMAILGAERALKRHYKDDEAKFKALLQRAVDDGLINDAIFDRVEPLSKDLLKRVDKEAKQQSHSHKLVSLIAALRNQFFHGAYWLSPEFLPLTIQLRQIADALQTHDFPKAK